MIENAFIIPVRISNLYLYGKNISSCIPYLKTAVNDTFKSVEDICKYCSYRGIKIYYWPELHSFKGFCEFIRIRRLTNKYSVSGTKWELFMCIGLHDDLS